MGNIFGRKRPQLNRETDTWLPADIGYDENGVPIERIVFANYADRNLLFRYPNNYISTCKYTILTFLPKNLFEQFQRLANAYFLVLLVLQCIPAVSSLDPITTAVPLVFVLSISAVKDAYDDIKRFRSDKTVNKRDVEVFRNGEWVEILWENVAVGDMARVENNDAVCADMVLLTSSEPNGECYVDTAELDGETNLKIRQSQKDVRAHLTDDAAFSTFQGLVVCEPPNTELHTFTGKLSMGDKMYPLDNDNVLLRGMNLRNTEWAVGIVVFAGHDTKLMMNASGARFKRTKVDEMMNRMIINIFGALCFISFISAVGAGIWTSSLMPGFQYYLPYESGLNNAAVVGIVSFFSFIVLYNTLVPISLYVSVEMIRLVQSWLIDDDLDMYDEKTDTPARARTTTLNEELGQIEYIFSDKTGTLTQNVMRFMKCSINGSLYGKGMTDVERNQHPERQLPDPVDFSGNRYHDPDFKFWGDELYADAKTGAHDVGFFFRLLALCHSAQPEVLPDGNLKYNSQSPDETALVSAAKNFGYVFKARTQDQLVLEVNGRQEVYELLNLLDFTSDRKRMTVVLRFPDGKIRALMKGADTIVLGRIVHDDQRLESITNQHLEAFASDGLRTLCLAHKEMEEQEWSEWNDVYQKAQLDLNNRDAETAKAAELLERNMHLFGATAIEDKLQEGAPAAIANLRKAGIKIWVLTGDKQETAINIGFACQLLTNDMQIFIVNEHTKTDVLDRLQALKDQVDSMLNPVEKALVIDGASLTFALEEECKLELLDVATACKSVICCRVSPIQKAEVVRLVKDNKNAVTLAIGDGANDVSMIQAAHIGVGISGLEGRQAVLASDYSIAQFRFLERLLLVHGRWSYLRMSKFLKYFFYKNFAFTLIQFWFQFNCGFSAQSAFQSWIVSLYNVVFTSLPVLALGVFEQDVGKRYSLQHPHLYIIGQKSMYFNHKTFLMSLFVGVWHSAVVYYFAFGVFGFGTNFSNGWTAGYELQSTAMSWAIIFVVTMVMALETTRWTVYNHAFIWGSLISWWIFCLYMFQMPMMIWGYESFYGVMETMVPSANFWWYWILTSAICVLPIMVEKYVTQMYFPSTMQIVREIAFLNRKARRKGPSGVPAKVLEFTSSAGFGSGLPAQEGHHGDEIGMEDFQTEPQDK